MLFVLCIQSILHRFAFGGDKLLLKNAYVIPNAAVQLACKIERNAEFKVAGAGITIKIYS